MFELKQSDFEDCFLLGIMDQYTTSIQSKMSKLENSCSDLSNEIITALTFIFRLKENFTEIVRKLNSVTAPEVFLKEFVGVHSLILKYQSFLTEINCKFEMLEMSEMRTQKLLSTNKAITSKLMSKSVNKLDIFFNCESFRDLKFTSDNLAFRKLVVEQVEQKSNVLLPKKSSKKKSKQKKMTSLEAQSEKKIPIDVQVDNINCNENLISHKNDENISNEKNMKEKKNSDTASNMTDSLDKRNFSDFGLVHSKKSLHPNGVDAKMNSDLNKKMPCSKISLFPKTWFDKNDLAKIQLIYSTDMSDSVKCNVDNSSSNKIQCYKTKSPIEDVSQTEAFPTENVRYEYSVEVSNENEENDIKPPNIVKNLGREYDVVIEHIKSPSEFYISVIDNQPNSFVELEKKLKSLPENRNKYCSKTNENRKVCLSKEIGTYGLFYSKCDEMWYRVKIINWCLNLKDDYVSIFLIDYGESKCVSIDDLQPLPECFKKYPAFTQKCHLSGVFPLDMDKNSKTLCWGKESTEKMKYLTENSKKVRLKIAPNDCYHPSTSLPVTLWLVDQGNQCVNELLVKSKYAVEESAFNQQMPPEIITETPDSYCVEIANINDWNPMREDFESYKNSYDLDINDPAALIYGYVGKDYERICSHFARTGRCFKGQACKKEHQKLDPLGFTTDQEEVFKNAFNSLNVPPPNSVLNVQVTCLLAFNRFCCISDTSRFFFDEENLQTLLKFMNEPENVLRMKKLLIPPSAGQIVIARYSEDRSWYRARILDSEPESDLYRVVFVDYGNKELVSLSNIRAIEARYLHLPFQAIECFIFGIDRNPEASLNDVMDYINKRINDGHISIEVVARLPGEDISLLVNVFDQSGRNIGKDLIENKYAIYKQEMIISSETKSMPG